MTPGPSRSLLLPLTSLSLPAIESCPLTLNCLECQDLLDLHQPEMTDPDRLLGVCRQCDRWYLICLDVDQSTANLVRLPGFEEMVSIAPSTT